MCLDDTAKTMLPKKRIAAPYHFWFPGVLGFGIILGFRIIGFGFRIILGFRIIGFGFRITRFWLQNHPWFQNHSATNPITSGIIIPSNLVKVYNIYRTLRVMLSLWPKSSLEAIHVVRCAMCRPWGDHFHLGNVKNLYIETIELHVYLYVYVFSSCFFSLNLLTCSLFIQCSFIYIIYIMIS